MSNALHTPGSFDAPVASTPGPVAGSESTQEARIWAWLAIGSLGVAGAFALMLAVSRIPGIERIMAWPLGFFAKGLVIHVVFSLVVWFLAVFALLTTIATDEIDPAVFDRGGAPGLGQLGVGLVALAFPLLFLPAFRDDSIASLNNYVPAIIHPEYYVGLVVLFAGIACPVLRHFTAVGRFLKTRRLGSARNRRHLAPLAFAMTAAGIIYLVALASFAIAFVLAAGSPVTSLFNEYVFWGGGHVLQFLNTALLLTGWFLLLRATLGPQSIGAATLRIPVAALVVCALAAPAFYLVLPAFAPLQQEAFRRLQFVLGFPTLFVALNGVVAVNAARRAGSLPWHDAGFVALVLSPIVFGAGGAMGLMISGSDTRTPAHYHGMITGVNLACMGLFLKIVLPRLTGIELRRGAVRGPILLFGLGQLAACVGLFWAGGYGAPRKAVAGSVRLLDGAVWGMYLNGIGALLAVIGGVLFVVAVVRSLRSRPGPEATQPALAA